MGTSFTPTPPACTTLLHDGPGATSFVRYRNTEGEISGANQMDITFLLQLDRLTRDLGKPLPNALIPTGQPHSDICKGHCCQVAPPLPWLSTILCQPDW